MTIICILGDQFLTHPELDQVSKVAIIDQWTIELLFTASADHLKSVGLGAHQELLLGQVIVVVGSLVLGI